VVLEERVRDESCVVDQEIDVPERGRDLRHRGVDGCTLGDVARDGDGGDAAAADLVRERLQPIEPPGKQRDVRPAGGEVARELLADAARRAGDDGHPIAEVGEPARHDATA
jgi:hypothetical protein